MFDIWEAAKAAGQDATRHRRYLYEHPELSGYERGTVSYICSQLDGYGIGYTVIPNGGVLARIDGVKEGRTVLLRADCDALAITESTVNGGGQAKRCVSTNPGVAHMCGHDSHTAMLLAAGKVLQEHRDELEGSVLLLFERGEEGARCIYYVMEYLQTHGIAIDGCWANHVVNDLPVGDVAIQGGETNAAVFEYTIRLRGRDGHASRPDRSVNPIDCFTAIASDMRGFAMQHTSPFDPLTHCISFVHAGTVSNVIAAELTFGGTCRFFNLEAGRAFERYLKDCVAGCCARYGCTAEYPAFAESYLPTICSEPLAQFGRRVVGDLIGSEHIIPRSKAMGSESYGVLSTFYPSVTAKVGIRNEKQGITAPVHTAEFEIDEAAMPYGILMYTAYAVEFLRQKPEDPGFKPFAGTIRELFESMHCGIPEQFDSMPAPGSAQSPRS